MTARQLAKMEMEDIIVIHYTISRSSECVKREKSSWLDASFFTSIMSLMVGDGALMRVTSEGESGYEFQFIL